MSSRRAAPWAAVAAFVIASAAVGCGRNDSTPSRTETRAPVPLPVRILADSASGGTLPVRAPDAQAWLAGVASTPPKAPSAPSGASPSEIAPLPDAAPDTTFPVAAPPPSLVIDPALKAPIPRSTPPLRIPARHGGRNEVESVELAVYVDPRGQVEVAKWAGGTSDTALVRAAVECASAMTFYPAMRGGEAIGVWCRQRFDFTR